MNQAIQQFITRLAEVLKEVDSTSGLDMTETEQLQRIADLEAAIRQKEELLAECARLVESWHDQA
jgi:hypothetical protein